VLERPLNRRNRFSLGECGPLSSTIARPLHRRRGRVNLPQTRAEDGVVARGNRPGIGMATRDGCRLGASPSLRRCGADQGSRGEGLGIAIRPTHTPSSAGGHMAIDRPARHHGCGNRCRCGGNPTASRTRTRGFSPASTRRPDATAPRSDFAQVRAQPSKTRALASWPGGRGRASVQPFSAWLASAPLITCSTGRRLPWISPKRAHPGKRTITTSREAGHPLQSAPAAGRSSRARAVVPMRDESRSAKPAVDELRSN